MSRRKEEDSSLLESGELPFLVALNTGDDTSTFSVRQRYREILLLENRVTELNRQLQGVRKQIYSAAKVLNPAKLQVERYLLEHIASPFGWDWEEDGPYTEIERVRELSNFDKHVAEQKNRLNRLRCEERHLVRERDWGQEQQQRIWETINPLLELFESMEKGIRGSSTCNFRPQRTDVEV